MRAWILLVLSGTVLFFVWSSFHGAEEPSPEAEPGVSAAGRASGRLLSVGEMEQALTSEVSEEDPGPTEEEASGMEVSVAPAEVPARPSLDWNLGDPVAEGSLLLHAVERLPEYLEGPGKELSSGRKSLLFGFGLLIRGLEEHAGRYRDAVVQATDVTSAERELFLSVLEGGRPRALGASASRESALLLGVRMALLDKEAATLVRDQRHREAAEAYSALLLAEAGAPWPADRELLRRWTQALADAQEQHRWNRQGEWPSFEVEAKPGDNLVEIRKRVLASRPDMLMCTGLIARSNQLGRYLQPGTLRIPSDRVSVLVDLGARWVFYLHGAEVVAAWEVAIGKEGKTSPGSYLAGEKLEDPPWFQPGQPPVPFGDPRNPLGTRWIAWQGSESLGFHGTWEPQTIGTEASEGCIRMRNEDVEELFEILPKGAPIEVRP